MRGPEGSLIQTPLELFTAAAEAGVAVELNLLCIQEILRAFAGRNLQGSLFLNISPQLILQRGFDQERAARFLQSLAIEPERVVIELTEDYPTLDFQLVHESLMLYRSMGFRIAIDDLGEGFASLRLWSELKPEFVKADKHFVTGIADDPVKMQFLRAIQQIAENSGSQVIAEGIENAADFKVVKDIGIACGQGWFIGRPSEHPDGKLPPEAERAQADARVPVVPAPRLRAGTEPRAHDFVRAVDAGGAAGEPRLGARPVRLRSPTLAAIPVIGAAGIEGVVSRAWLDLVRASPDAQTLRARPCIEFADRAPIKVEADLDLAALTAILVESDARRMADGFVIVSRGRYLGMGTSADVMRSLQSSRVLAARYTNPLTLLPGQVPINEHLERLLAGTCPSPRGSSRSTRCAASTTRRAFRGRRAHPRHRAPRRIGVRARRRLRRPRHRQPLRAADAKRGLAGARRAPHRRVFPGAGGPRAGAGARARLLHREAPRRPRVRAAAAQARHRDPPGPAGPLRITPRGGGGRQARRRKAQAQPASAIYVDQQHGNAYPQSLLFGDDA